MIGVLKDTVVRGIAAAVPTQIEKNSEAASILGERRCKKQIKLTGVMQRHVVRQGQKISDLCYCAAKNLMAHLKWKPEEVNVLVLLTQTANYMTPSTAFLLQKLLHLPKDAVVFDVNLGCSSFNVGLQIVSALLQQCPSGAKGLCLQGDLAFQSIYEGAPPDVLAGSLLFGAAGSAVAVEKKDGNDIPFATFSDGTGYTAILRRYGENVSMEGEKIFNFSTNDVADSIRDFMSQMQISDEDVDFYIFHQAQKMILDNIALTCNIPRGKELRSIADYGNTSGASVPLSLCVNTEQFQNKEFIQMFSCGFGVGLSWSMAYNRVEVKDILPVIFSDEIYEG